MTTNNRIKMHCSVRKLDTRNFKSKKTPRKLKAWLHSFNIMRAKLKQGINNDLYPKSIKLNRIEKKEDKVNKGGNRAVKNFIKRYLFRCFSIKFFLLNLISHI
jgi:hypothetical protein